MASDAFLAACESSSRTWGHSKEYFEKHLSPFLTAYEFRDGQTSLLLESAWHQLRDMQAKLAVQPDSREALLRRIRLASEGSFTLTRGTAGTLTAVPFGHEPVRIIVAALVQLVAAVSPELRRCYWPSEVQASKYLVQSLEEEDDEAAVDMPLCWHVRKPIVPRGAEAWARCMCTPEEALSLLHCDSKLAAQQLHRLRDPEQTQPIKYCTACERLRPLPLCITLCAGTTHLIAARRSAVMLAAQEGLIAMLQPSPAVLRLSPAAAAASSGQPFLQGSPPPLPPPPSPPGWHWGASSSRSGWAAAPEPLTTLVHLSPCAVSGPVPPDNAVGDHAPLAPPTLHVLWPALPGPAPEAAAAAAGAQGAAANDVSLSVHWTAAPFVGGVRMMDPTLRLDRSSAVPLLPAAGLPVACARRVLWHGCHDTRLQTEASTGGGVNDGAQPPWHRTFYSSLDDGPTSFQQSHRRRRSGDRRDWPSDAAAALAESEAVFDSFEHHVDSERRFGGRSAGLVETTFQRKFPC